MHLAHSASPVVPRDRLIRLPEVCHLTGLGKTSIYDLMKKSRFPTRIKFNARAAMWKESDVLTWIQKTVAEAQHTQQEAA